MFNFLEKNYFQKILENKLYVILQLQNNYLFSYITLRGFASSLIKRGAKKVLKRCQNHRNFIFLELISSLRIGLNNTPY